MRTLYQLLMLALLTNCILYASAINAAKLTIPESFDVIKVDGNTYDESLFVLDKQLVLGRGSHTLELQYDEYFEDPDSDGHVFIKSEPFLITFTVSDNQDLILSRPPFDDESSARIYAEKPKVLIKNTANVITELPGTKVPTEKLLTHTQLEVNSSTELPPIQETTMVATEVFIDDSSTQASQIANKSRNKLKTRPDVSLDKLIMLKYWWQQASAEEREGFKQYIDAQ